MHLKSIYLKRVVYLSLTLVRVALGAFLAGIGCADSSFIQDEDADADNVIVNYDGSTNDEDAGSQDCEPTAQWGHLFETGEPVANFQQNGLFDVDGDGEIDSVAADFDLEDVFCHGFKSAAIMVSTFS